MTAENSITLALTVRILFCWLPLFIKQGLHLSFGNHFLFMETLIVVAFFIIIFDQHFFEPKQHRNPKKQSKASSSIMEDTYHFSVSIILYQHELLSSFPRSMLTHSQKVYMRTGHSLPPRTTVLWFLFLWKSKRTSNYFIIANCSWMVYFEIIFINT